MRTKQIPSRKIEMNAPICVGADIVTPSGLIYLLAQEKNGIVALTSKGEVPSDRFEKPGLEPSTKEGILNYDLLTHSEVAQQFIKQEGGFIFPSFVEETLSSPDWEMSWLGMREKKVKIRTVAATNLIDAIKSCIPNIDPEYRYNGNPEKVIANWYTKLSQLEVIKERLGQARLIHDYNDGLKIIVDLDNGGNSQKGISFSAIRFDTAGLGLGDSDCYPLQLNLRLDVRPSLVLGQNNTLGNYLTPEEIRVIEESASQKANEIAPQPREKVSVNFESKVNAFAIRRDNIRSNSTVEDYVPTQEIISHAEILGDYVAQAIKIGWEKYEVSAAKAKSARFLETQTRIREIEERIVKKE